MDSWYLAAVKGSAGTEKMPAEDPVRRFCLGTLRNIPVQIICIFLVGLQAFLLNHHLVVVSLTFRHSIGIIHPCEQCLSLQDKYL